MKRYIYIAISLSILFITLPQVVSSQNMKIEVIGYANGVSTKYLYFDYNDSAEAHIDYYELKTCGYNIQKTISKKEINFLKKINVSRDSLFQNFPDILYGKVKLNVIQCPIKFDSLCLDVNTAKQIQHAFVDKIINGSLIDIGGSAYSTKINVIFENDSKKISIELNKYIHFEANFWIQLKDKYQCR